MGTVQTQKAKGIKALALYQPKQFTTTFVKDVSVYPHDPIRPFPFFARPCPMTPRHGFVDSRTVTTKKQFEALAQACRDANEPDFEIIQMPFVPTTLSGILTPSGVTYGEGHDGATSGVQAKQIPASADRPAFLKAFGLESAALESGVTETPYLEFIEWNGTLEAVQLRNGPAVPTGNTYVPSDMTVERVVKANGEDLMEWEQAMKALAAEHPTGVVIWHPQGAMSSHYAVQAIEQSKGLAAPFAVLIQDAEPVLGTLLTKTGNAVPALEKADHAELAKMIAFAVTNMRMESQDRSASIHLAIGALHAQALWGNDRHLLVLRAAGLAYMLKFASAAILGELRHWAGSGPGGHGKTRKTRLFELDDKKYLSRDQVYARAFEQHISLIAPRMATAYADFHESGWGASIGGKKWGDCTKSTAELFHAAAIFVKQPSAAHWTAVTTAWNLTVNMFHNTGAFLNKFIHKSAMDTLAVCPSFGLASSLVGTLAVYAGDFGLHRNPGTVAKMLDVKLPTLKAIQAEKKATTLAKQFAPIVSVEEVTLTPVVAPTPFQIPAEIDVRWNCMGVGSLYLQLKLATSINRPYGLQCQVTIADEAWSSLKALTLDGYSLTGNTQTVKGTGTIETLDGLLVLKTTVNDLWVPLLTTAAFQQLAAMLKTT